MDAPPVSLEQLLDRIASLGFVVSNLFQLPEKNCWRANLRSATLCYDFGEGKTASQALLQAMAKLALPGEALRQSSARGVLPAKARPASKPMPGELTVDDLF